jgi:DNA-binding transcriptional MocR family regulator
MDPVSAIEWTRILGSWPEAKGPLHARLSLGIRNAISHGLLVHGSRLPSERALADALQVSRNTVVAAYNALRDDGWLESQTGNGTWIRKNLSTPRGTQREVDSTLLGVLDREGEDAIDFATGTPYPLQGFPAKALRLPEHEYERLLRTRLYYPFGLPELREAIAARYSHEGLSTTRDEILVTTGAQQAIMLAASLFLQRGDTALVEDPCYFGAVEALRSAGARLQTLAVGKHGVEPQEFRDSATASGARLVYLTPTFQNPTGTVMPARARAELVGMAAQRSVPVIDDRTLADIELESGTAAETRPLAMWDKTGSVLTIGSLGKLMWAGLRIGWIRAARHQIERLVRLKMAYDLGTALPMQAQAARLFAFYDEAKALRRVELSAKRDLVASLIGEMPGNWQFNMPAGGLFLWVTLPHGDARELAQVAMRQGLILLPGTNMSTEQKHANVLRIPFLLDEKDLREGMRRFTAAWREYSPETGRGYSPPRPEALSW